MPASGLIPMVAFAVTEGNGDAVLETDRDPNLESESESVPKSVDCSRAGGLKLKKRSPEILLGGSAGAAVADRANSKAVALKTLCKDNMGHSSVRTCELFSTW